MVRKKRTDLPGEGSGYRESSESGGPQRPVGRTQVPQQQGSGYHQGGGRGGQGGGRGGAYYQGQGRGGGPQPCGGITPQPAGSPMQEYQGRSGAPQPRGPQFPQPHGGGIAPQQYEYRGHGRPQPGGRMSPHQHAGGQRGGLSGSLSRRPPPELHQATQPTYQASQPSSTTKATSSQLQPPVITFGQVEQQFQQFSVQGEEKPAQAIQAIIPAASSKSMRFPSRPGMGSYGDRCIVKANHFLAELPDKDLHQYDVSITPEVTSRGVNRAVIKQLITLYRQSRLGGRLPAYDGRKSLYTAGPLPFSSDNFEISLLDEEEGPGAQRRERLFKVTIKFASRADLHHLELFLAGRQADAPQEALQVLDIVLRELPTARYTPVGRSFYSGDLGKRKSLGDGLESWRGFYQSIRPTQMGLSLNIDMSFTAFIEPLPVIDFVAQLLSKDVSARPLSDADRVKVYVSVFHYLNE